MFMVQEIGKKIVDLRKKKNMTQMELADLMGVSFQAVSNWERGESMPDISKLPELAQILDVTVDKLLGDTIEEKKEIQEKEEDSIMIKKNIFPSFQRVMEGITEDMKLVNQQEIELDKIQTIVADYSTDKIIFYPSENNNLILKEYMNQDKEEYYAKIRKEKEKIEILSGKREALNFLQVLIEIYIPADFHKNLEARVKSGSLKFELEQVLSSFKAEASSGSIKMQAVKAEQIKIQNNSGSIKMDRIDGNFDIFTGSGSIKIADCRGKGNLVTNSGSIKFVTCNIEGEIKSNSGSIKGEVLYTDRVTLHSSSGSIKITELRGEFSINSASGSISIESCDGNGELNTHSGSIKLALKKINGNMKVHADTGCITVDFQESINAKIEANSRNGIIRAENTERFEKFEKGKHFIKGELGKGGEINILLDTHSGSIKIR